MARLGTDLRPATGLAWGLLDSGVSDEDCLVEKANVDSAPWGVEGIIESMWRPMTASYPDGWQLRHTVKQCTGAGRDGRNSGPQHNRPRDRTIPGVERDGVTPTPTSFDISGVDTTNFPELNCSLALNLTWLIRKCL